MTTDLYGYDPELLGLERGKYRGKDEMHVCCPFHGGTGKSASFNIRTGKFYCFKCGAKASVSEIANQLGGIIEKRFIPEKQRNEDNWRVHLQAPINTNNEYLLKRGVTPKQIEEFEIRSLEKGVGIPLKNHNGSVVGMVIRNYRGSHRYIYAGDRLEGWPLQNVVKYDRMQPIIVVEGIFGALRGLKYGYNVIASLGVMFKLSLKGQWLSQFKRTIVIYDADVGGCRGYLRMLEKAQRIEVVIPGFETDECDQAMWDYIVNKARKTSDKCVIEKILRNRDAKRKSVSS